MIAAHRCHLIRAAASAPTDFLFFPLELNRLDDALAVKLAETGPLAHYLPWLADIREEKPYELDDEIEKIPGKIGHRG